MEDLFSSRTTPTSVAGAIEIMQSHLNSAYLQLQGLDAIRGLLAVSADEHLSALLEAPCGLPAVLRAMQTYVGKSMAQGVHDKILIRGSCILGVLGASCGLEKLQAKMAICTPVLTTRAVLKTVLGIMRYPENANLEGVQVYGMFAIGGLLYGVYEDPVSQEARRWVLEEGFLEDVERIVEKWPLSELCQQYAMMVLWSLQRELQGEERAAALVLQAKQRFPSRILSSSLWGYIDEME